MDRRNWRTLGPQMGTGSATMDETTDSFCAHEAGFHATIVGASDGVDCGEPLSVPIAADLHNGGTVAARQIPVRRQTHAHALGERRHQLDR